MQAAKDLARLHIYTGSPEPSFLDTAMSPSTKIKCAGSFNLFFAGQALIYLAYKNVQRIERMYFISMIMFQFGMLNS